MLVVVKKPSASGLLFSVVLCFDHGKKLLPGKFQPFGLRHRSGYEPPGKTGAPLFPKQLCRSRRNKHAHAALFVDDAFLHQQIDALQGCGGIDGVLYGKFRNGRDLASLRKRSGKDSVLDPLGDLLKNRFF